jgi:hypothetical protein
MSFPPPTRLLTPCGRRDSPPPASGRWPTATHPSISAVSHPSLSAASCRDGCPMRLRASRYAVTSTKPCLSRRLVPAKPERRSRKPNGRSRMGHASRVPGGGACHGGVCRRSVKGEAASSKSGAGTPEPQIPGRDALSSSDNPLVEGSRDRLQPVGGSEGAENPLDVGSHRMHADIELLGDLA